MSLEIAPHPIPTQRATAPRPTRGPHAPRKSPMTAATPTTTNRTLRRLPNSSYRPTEYLTEAKVDRLIDAARRRGRTALGMLVRSCSPNGMASCCRALSAALVQIDLQHGRLHVNGAKGGAASVHPPPGSGASGAAAVARPEPVCVRHRGRNASDHRLVLTDGSTNRG
jgi:hypothetical protein